MNKEKLIYEGKAKKLFNTSDESIVWVEYLDQATALNGLRKDTVVGKGELNNQITSRIFEYLTQADIPNHFIEELSKTEQLVKKVKVIPLEVVVRNFAAGSFSKRFAIPEGTAIKKPIVEFYYKNDDLDDPFINEAHIDFLDIATASEVAELKEKALLINQALISLFQSIELKLIDFKLEFGRLPNGEIILADEISPDTCRLWDIHSNQQMDKDIYRKNLGDLVPVYHTVLTRLQSI